MKIGLPVRAVREPEKVYKKKMKKKGHQRYISRIRGGGTPKDGEMNFGTLVDPMEVINHANFHLHLMSSL